MQVRCPHCHDTVEVADDSSFRDVSCRSCGSHFNLVGKVESTATYSTDTRTLGHFELIEHVGAGHFGSVWKARDTKLDRMVAVKIPREAQIGEKEAESFFREARAAAQLRHPNIVSVHEVGRDGETIYIASDYILGATLREWLNGPLPPREAARLCAKIADALHAAHTAGVVHRDVKPGNIMMDLEQEPHIMDFGLAKRESGEMTMTVEGALLGTPAYMSPEQARGDSHSADGRSDVYSLGVVLFEMLTGELPFRGETRMLVVQILREDPPGLRKLNSAIPRDLETICLKALEKPADGRYQTALDLADDLRRFLDGKPVEARPIGRLTKTLRWCRRNRAVAGLLCLVSMLLLTGSAISMYLASNWKVEADFAHQETNRANQATGAAEQERDAARKERDAAKKAQQREVVARQAMEKRIAENFLEKGQQLCEEGEVGRGLLNIIRGLRSLPENNNSLERLFRSAIVSRRAQVNQLQQIVQHGEYYPLAISPDAKKYAVIVGNEQSIVRVWDLGSWAPIGKPMKHANVVTACVFNKDGTELWTASEDSKRVRKWDVAKGEPIGRIAMFDKPVGPIALHPEETELAVGIGSVVRIHSETLERIGSPLDYPGRAFAFSYSGDGRRIAAGGTDRIARVWDLETGEPVGLGLRHATMVTAVALGPEGKRLATGDERGVHLWEVKTGVPKWHGKHAAPVRCLTFSPDATKLLSGSFDQNGRVWNVADGAPIGQPLEHGFTVAAVTFSPTNDSVITASYYQTKHWKLPAETPLQAVLHHTPAPISLAVSADGKLVAAGTKDNLVLIRNLETGAAMGQPLPHPRQVTFLAFDHRGEKLLSRCEDGKVRLWDIDSGKLVGQPMPHDPQNQLKPRWSPDGRKVLTAPGGTSAQVWDAETATAIGPRIAHGARMNDLRFSPDGRWVLTGGTQRKVGVWDAENGKRIEGKESWQHPIQPSQIAFSPDGKRILIAGFHSAEVIELATGKLVGRVAHQGYLTVANYSPDGKLILTAGNDATVRLWDATTLLAVGQPMAHPGIRRAAFSRDGNLIAALSGDGQIRLWDVYTARNLGWALAKKARVYSFAFASEGSGLLTAAADGHVESWPLPETDTAAPETLRRSAELITGLKLDQQGAVTVHLLQGLQELRRELGSQNKGATFEVVSDSDSGEGSLRQAIIKANMHLGLDTIRFNIPGEGPHRIQPRWPLPTIYDSTLIDATTQPGYQGQPLVELDGSHAPRGHGLEVAASRCVIRGLAINRFPEHGIVLVDGSSSIVEGNHLGTDPTGTAALGNGRAGVGCGILVRGQGHRIGTDGDGVEDAREKNVVSANSGDGIHLQRNSSQNRIAGNYVGTDSTGKRKLPNQKNGILVSSGSTQNRIENNLIFSRKASRSLKIRTPGQNNIGTNPLLGE